MPNAPNKFLYQFLTTLLSIQFFFASSPPAAWVGCFATRNEFGPASLAEKPRLPAQENANDVAIPYILAGGTRETHGKSNEIR